MGVSNLHKKKNFGEIKTTGSLPVILFRKSKLEPSKNGSIGAFNLGFTVILILNSIKFKLYYFFELPRTRWSRRTSIMFSALLWTAKVIVLKFQSEKLNHVLLCFRI